MKNLKENFIKKAKEIYGDKYYYSKVEYVNNKTKVCITCPEHGDFWKTPNIFLRGQKCPYCSGGKLNKKIFIEKARKIHGDKYDYSKVKYKNNCTKVCIICPEHGEFWQNPSSHLMGQGCFECAKKRIGEKNKKLTTEGFITRAREIHGNKYDYSKTEYVNPTTKVEIFCKKHNKIFSMLPYNHINGQGCPICRYEKISNKLKYTKEEFILKVREVHEWKYDYSKVEYNNIFDKVCIICPKHGEFWQRPSDHLSGCGCPLCKESHLEREVSELLIEENVSFSYQKTFDWLKNKNNLYLDFYLPDYNIAIECQGIQHFQPVEFFGGEEKYKETIERDKKKKELCEKNNIELLYILDKDDLETKILDKLYQLKTKTYNKLNSID